MSRSNGTLTSQQGNLLVNFHSLFDPVINSLVELKSQGMDKGGSEGFSILIMTIVKF